MPRKPVAELSAKELAERRKQQREAKRASRARLKAEADIDNRTAEERKRYFRVRHLKATRDVFVEPCPCCLGEILMTRTADVYLVQCTKSKRFIGEPGAAHWIRTNRKSTAIKKWNAYLNDNIDKEWGYA